MVGPSAATEPNAPPSATTAASDWVFYLVHPPALAGRQIPLRASLPIGRDAGDGHIAHATVSRRHATVLSKANGFWLQDLGSRNGTRLNGTALREPAYLLPQAVVRFGDVLAVVTEPIETAFEADPVLPGTGPAILRARELLSRAAADAAPVLILGETGAGKERVAQEVHRASGRRGPCRSLNTAELSRELIESQLFGHRRGAFTGANTSSEGLFLAAHGGSLFLDEIGELPLELQPKLLRVLEDGLVRPVGSVETRAVDVRVIAATHQDLSRWVEVGRFRRDLYARLSIWEIAIPPLRARRQDLLRWVSLLSEAEGGPGAALLARFHPDALERVLVFSFPDNLRGLKRLVHRLSRVNEPSIGLRVLGENMSELMSDALEADGAVSASRRPRTGGEPASAAPRPSAESSRVLDSEPRVQNQPAPSREQLLAVLRATGFNVRATSKYFGRDRRQIYRWLTTYGIERPPHLMNEGS